jgi:RNA polymerase sigma-70 factor (ECF subfamily)
MTISLGKDRVAGFDQTELVALIPQMRAFARTLCRNRADGDDLAQDALVRAWGRRDSHAPGTNLKAWVFMIVRNKFYADRRRAWRSVHLDPRIAEETLVAVTSATASLDLDDVRRAMLELSDEQREALTLVAVAGLPYQEVAVICGCAEGTVKSRVSRARRRLTEVLALGEMAVQKQPPGVAMATILADAQKLRAGFVTRPRYGRAVDAKVLAHRHVSHGYQFAL